MIYGCEKCNSWLNCELQSPHFIERHSKLFQYNFVKLFASGFVLIKRLKQSFLM